MKKNMKYFLLGLSTSLMLPIITNAATMKISGNDSDSNVAKYDLMYTGAEGEDTTLNFEVSTNTNLKPNVIKNEEGGIIGECNKDKGSCFLKLPSNYVAGNEIKIATIELTNTTTEEISPTITVNMGGTKMTDRSGFKLKPGQTAKPKSNNASLTNLGLSVGNLDKTFDSNIFEYTITGIKDTINSITINPTCDNCEIKITCPNGTCNVSNTKKVTLQTGANEVNINVTSEDGTNNKTYKLNIYRGEVTTSSAYLQNLKIKDVVLSPTFNSMTNDYSARLTKDLDKVEITTITEDPSAKVEIKGNEKLKDGENTITITVTSSDGENKQVYTIKLTKEKEDKKTKKTTTVVKKKKNYTWLIILLSVLGLGIIIGAYILIFKKKKNKNNKKDKNDKNNNDKNNNDNLKKEQNKEKSELDMLEESKYDVYGQEINEDDLLDDMEESDIKKENTDSLRILEETKRQMKEEPKQDVDEALDDLMKTKKLELGDLDF